jgi:hypothetical protein
MQAVNTIGLDIAKSAFQVHGIDAKGNVIIRRQLKRRYVLAFFQKVPPCLVGIEACASSHYWSRELSPLACLAPPNLGLHRAPTFVALTCRWRSRPQHQKRTSARWRKMVMLPCGYRLWPGRNLRRPSAMKLPRCRHITCRYCGSR